MAETSPKYLSVPRDTFFSDFNVLSPFIKKPKALPLAYGFISAFVFFSVFLIFHPSSGPPSPFFFPGASSSPPTTFRLYRSRYTSIVSYFFQNSSSHVPLNQARPFLRVPTPPTTGKTSDLTVAAPTQNGTLPLTPVLPPPLPEKVTVTSSTEIKTTPQPTSMENVIVAASPATSPSVTTNTTVATSIENTTKPLSNDAPPPPVTEKVTVAASTEETRVEKVTVAASSSQTRNFPTPTPTPTPKTEKAVIAASDRSSGTSKETSGGGNSTAELKKGTVSVSDDEKTLESLAGCDLHTGVWVRDESYPLYKHDSCPVIDEQFNCILNGRPDHDYQKLKWKPNSCTLPRLDGRRMLELLRGKRLVFVGDSLNRNMWESLVCILRGSAKDPTRVFEASGSHQFRTESSYSFIFQDYNCSVEFFVTPFLVREWKTADGNGSKKETLRLDLIESSADHYKTADVLVFNTGHWWTHDKTSKGMDYYQEGSHIYSELNVLEAFRKALTTWGRWVDANVDPSKTAVFFRGYSASHFSGGQWNSGGACNNETRPIGTKEYLKEYPDKMMMLERVMKGMKTRVNFLNVTEQTDYRKDGHPSIYRKQYLTPEERQRPLLYQDCSHWCLPGVPDSWNEILYAELLIRERRK